MENIKRAKECRQEYFAANTTMIEKSAQYRSTIKLCWEEARLQGTSKRELARRLEITEGSLRDLLRPAGTTRREKRKK